MAAKVRVGVLGGGGILGAHAPGFLKAADRCTVVAVAEPDESRHARIRQLLGEGVRLCSDYREVLAMPDVDAVDIILPHFLHLPATLAAAEAGKPVLVEKVMARNVWECDRMIEACEKAGVSLTVCHDRRYHGQWMALKEVVDSGALGEIFYWKLEHNQNVLFPEGSWVRRRDGIGGGAIMSCLTHQIDSLRYYGGEVKSVTCMTHVLPDRMEGETVGIIAARMASGALAQLSINWFTRSHCADRGLWYELVHVCGTRGEAYYQSGKGTFVLLHDSSAAAIERYGRAALEGFVPVPSGEWTGHERCILEWVKHLRGEEARILTNGREVRGTVEVAEAAYLAEETGQTVTLPIEPRPWPTADTSK
ncbi:MAG TPA: Gfo/Idh/MocA family oxidoreductase [Armatimonadetes bacterium]|jgi:UDP-N-acetyl-2-amino-2-deoxyglucuronate dehydrogenase|nr:Gfo/Idh/MocA family oxidoreductase [Armatimonadota bacterium]